MVKKSSFQKEYKANRNYNSRFGTILKALAPYLIVIFMGLLSFIFVFPEILKWLPSERLGTIGISIERITSSIVAVFTIVFSNRIFQISIVILVVIFVVVLLLPFRPVEDGEFFTQKKMLIPFFRKVGVVIAHSPILTSSNTYMYTTHANRIHQAFMNCLKLKIKRLSFVIYKHRDSVSILFPVMSKGFSKKKIEEQLRRTTVFISSSIETHYNGKTKFLSSKQTKNLLSSLNELSERASIDLSSNSLGQFNLADQLYNIMIKNNTSDICFLARTEEKGKKENRNVIDLVALSANKDTESFLLNASGLNKKTKSLSKRNSLIEKLLASSVRSKSFWDIDDIATLIHIPYNYRGGSISLATHRNDETVSNIMRNQDIIVIGKSVEEDDANKDIVLDVKDLLLNVEIYGMIGRGKTQLVSSLLSQLLDKRISTIVFDIKGEYSRAFAEDSRVEIFTIGRPRPLCINIFETLDEDDVRNTLLIIEEMMMASNQEFTPAMKNLFENALFLTHKSQKRNLETFVENLFTVSRQVQSQTNISYIQQTIDAVLNRLNFIFNPINFEILGSSQTTLDFSSLEGGKSIILDLSQFQRRAARPSDIFLICNLILKMLYRYAAAKEMTSKLRFVTILEEAINIIPNFYHSESSASLITAENNFLLGRSIGIGHVTVSQLWDSVSNIVHGNSATKVVFRSSEKADLIGRTLNLSEEEVSRMQRLPTQHCYAFFDGAESAIQIKTLDVVGDLMSYSEYRTKLLKRYGRSVFPLLYNNFIDMRTSLYQRSGQRTHNKPGRGKATKYLNNNQNRLDNFMLENKQLDTAKKQIEDPSEKEALDLIASADLIPENLICERLCPDKNHNRECLKYNMGAKIIKTSILRQNSLKDTVSVLNDEDKLYSLILEIANKRNLDFNDFLVFCTVKSIILDFASDNLLSVPRAYELLKKFSPRPQTTIV